MIARVLKKVFVTEKLHIKSRSMLPNVLFPLYRLASINVFANNPAMLIFLQTGLSKHQMDYYLKTRTPGGIRSLILRLHDKKLKNDEEQRRPRTKTFSAEYPPTEK